MTSLTKFGYSILLASVLTPLSYFVGLYNGWITEVNWLEAFAVYTSYSCTYLCVMQSRWNYPIGFVSVVALAFLFYNQGLLASAALNVYLIPVLLYGWWRWGPDETTRPVTSVFKDSPIWWLGYVGVTAITYVTCIAIVTAFGGSLPFVDAAILVGSILAQFLLDNKKIETWAVWAMINVAAMWLYFDMGLYLVAFQYIFFLGNTIWGAWQWTRPVNKELANA